MRAHKQAALLGCLSIGVGVGSPVALHFQMRAMTAVHKLCPYALVTAVSHQVLRSVCDRVFDTCAAMIGDGLESL